MAIAISKSLLPVLAITAVALSISVPTPWVGLVYLLAGVVAFFVGDLVISGIIKDGEDAQSATLDGFDQAGYLVVRLAVGFVVVLLIFTIGFYLFKAFIPIALLIIPLTVWGWLRCLRSGSVCTVVHSSALSSVILIVGLASLLALAHFGIYEVRWGENYMYRLFREDISHYAFAGSLIRESGMPLIELSGSPEFGYFFLAWNGIPTLIAGISKTTLITPVQSLRLLAVWGYIIIGLSSLALLKGVWADGWKAGLVAFTVFLFGGIYLLTEALRGNTAGLVNPYLFAVVKPGTASGSFYHSMTQVWSTALAGASFVALRGAIQKNSRWIIPFCFLIAFSANVKPSYAIFILPATVILFALTRARLGYWIALILFTMVSLLLYYLPSLYAGQQVATGAEGWTINFHPQGRYFIRFFLLFGGLIGVGWIYWAEQIKQLISALKQHRVVGWSQYWAVGFFGSVVFALFFDQQNPNLHDEYWGMCGLLALGAPQITAFVYTRATVIIKRNRTATEKIIAYVILLVLFTQLLTGTVYALYQASNKQSENMIATERQLKGLKEKSAPSDKFAFDPLYSSSVGFLASNLARPILRNYFNHPIYTERWASYKQFLSEPSEDGYMIISNLSWIVLSNSRKEVEQLLVGKGWVEAGKVDEQFTLWKNPNAVSGNQGEQ